MRSRVVCGVAACGTFAVIAVFASSTAAQPAPDPVREIQASDGTLYLVQGNKSWTLVPDQASDSDVAALNPSGEIDGTLPNDLFVVQAPVSPPVVAPAPASAPPADVPAPPAAAPPPPAAAPAPTPITGTVDLTGKAASAAPGTLIAVGATITSVIDSTTKPQDFFAIPLSAGVTYHFFYSSKGYPNLAAGVYPTLLNPDGKTTAINGAGNLADFTPATTGIYYINQVAQGSGLRYTFSVKQ
jgi:hypothetical protein